VADNQDHENDNEEGEDLELALAPDVKARVQELKKYQAEFAALNKAKQAEIKNIEVKYAGLFGATFESRRKIVAGDVEAPDCPPGGSKGIPGFWLQAMRNSQTLSEFVEQRDEPALQYLTDVRSDFLPELKGFRLTFAFAPNPFFEEAELTKTFHMKTGIFDDEDEDEEANEEEEEEEEEGGAAAELERSTGVSKIEGCAITWKAGKNLTVEMQTKKGKGARGKKAKPVKKEVPVASFFRFFETPDMEAEGDDEAIGELVQSTQEEVRVAYFIREDLVPRALGFFLGEEDDGDEDEDEDEDGEGEDGEDGEEEDEEEEEEEEVRIAQAQVCA
jgi:nucleosome assembly protein 1-like 1